MRSALVVLLVKFSCICSAQEITSDSATISLAYQNAIGSIPKSQQSIYYGAYYSEITFDLKRGHPFFKSHLTASGQIEYNGINYIQAVFRYDLVRDEIVSEHFSGHQISLVKEKVARFTIHGRNFRYVTGTGLPSGGFYAILFEKEDIALLAKHEKKLRGNPHSPSPYIAENIRYFLKANGTYFKVKNSKMILDILKTKKKGLPIIALAKDSEKKMIEILETSALN